MKLLWFRVIVKVESKQKLCIILCEIKNNITNIYNIFLFYDFNHSLNEGSHSSNWMSKTKFFS